MYNIRNLRLERHMTQEELSKASGIHRVTIARYETDGSGMTVYNAQRIAAALGCTVNDLLESDEQREGA